VVLPRRADDVNDDRGFCGFAFNESHDVPFFSLQAM
jgi:hypothetical protein